MTRWSNSALQRDFGFLYFLVARAVAMARAGSLLGG
jgi:hypothetical protein